MSETIFRTNLPIYRHPKFIALQRRVEEQAQLIDELQKQPDVKEFIDSLKSEIKEINTKINTIIKDADKSNKALDKSITAIAAKLTKVTSKK